MPLPHRWKEVLVLIALVVGGCGVDDDATLDAASTSVEPTPTNTLVLSLTDRTGEIRLIDPLDEPEFYCIDVRGFGANIDLESDLWVHTCKLGTEGVDTSGAEDVIFSTDQPDLGQITLAAYKLCIVAGGLEPGSLLFLEDCSDNSLQRFAADDFGRLSPSGSTDLCVTVADDPGTPTGGPSHLWISLSLESCQDENLDRQAWNVPGGGLG